MRLANDKQTLDWIEEIGGDQYEAKFTHGTVYGYNKFKCRCEFCKEAKALSNQRAALKRAVKANPPQTILMMGGAAWPYQKSETT